MSAGWNFERRRDTCARFLLGVSSVVNGLADRDTSLEAVRSRMRLSPEEALFAARRLVEEQLIAFEAGGAVRSNARGIARAEALKDAVRSKARRHEEVVRALRAGGTALEVWAAVVQSEGGTMACGSPPDDPERAFRLTCVEAVAIERQRDDGTFEPAPVDP